MEQKLIFSPQRRKRGVSRNTMRRAGLAMVCRSSSEVVYADNDRGRVCESAFLAERGCLSEAAARTAQSTLEGAFAGLLRTRRKLEGQGSASQRVMT